MRRQRMPNGCSSWMPSVQDEKKGSNFFRIIHSFIIENRRLGLPRKFVRKFGKELSEVGVIIVSGKMWHVELSKADGEISFQNGWQEIMDYYSIRIGHFLVFKYDGNSRFHVLIFDMSASEIEYPSHTEDFEEQNHERIPETSASEIEYPIEENDAIENLDVTSACPTHGTNECDGQETSKPMYLKPVSCLPFSLQGIAENPSSNLKDEPEMVLVRSDSEGDGEPTMSTQLKCASSRGKDVWYSTKKIDNPPESSRVGFSAPQVKRRNGHDHGFLRQQESSAKAIRTARAFTSEYPFCKITMRPSYVSERFILNVPMDFAKAYLMQKTQSLTLRVSDGRTWNVDCVCGEFYTKLIKGWKEFVLDNHLEEGDICMFELVDRNSFETNVSIFRAFQDVV
ncbi:B3 DNA binding domain [Macleaya cordata]|uniref:B3 DNA binding domain n=1 Tax=Macleaya cordata TaxID=56857 RepID=A0A200Q3Z1_MACCD|nr:B3 DNA binding domain [Macleaya cordata]